MPGIESPNGSNDADSPRQVIENSTEDSQKKAIGGVFFANVYLCSYNDN